MHEDDPPIGMDLGADDRQPVFAGYAHRLYQARPSRQVRPLPSHATSRLVLPDRPPSPPSERGGDWVPDDETRENARARTIRPADADIATVKIKVELLEGTRNGYIGAS